MSRVTRREVLAGAGLAAASLAIPQNALPKPTMRSLRIAHLTDTHVQPELRAGEGFAACLRHLATLKDKPDVIFTGGDLIMDAFAAEHDRVETQWDLFLRVLADETDLPVEHCIGNHDVWGFADREGVHARKAVKKWACDVLKLERPYRSFDLGGWHVIVLDSTHPGRGTDYTARLDDEQFEWLKADLAVTPATRNVLVLSHIPILAACAYFDGINEKSGDWVVPGKWMHIDARRIKDLFRKHPNVKVALSGHVHLVDRVEYNGVVYLCNGAVSGGWWKGPYQECEPGYALVDLYEDGTVVREYVTFGWKAQG
jgi:3',5'-cyclic AMP phosphodiesterase CpdA